MIKAILGEYPYDTALNLTNLTGCANFWKSYEKTAAEILKCDNKHYITDRQKYFLQIKRNPIEPDMMEYLLMFDPLMNKLKNNPEGVKILMQPLYFTNGLIQMTIDQIKEFQDELHVFHQLKQEAIFVIFICNSSHWTTLVVHKTVSECKVDESLDQTIDEKIALFSKQASEKALRKNTMSMRRPTKPVKVDNDEPEQMVIRDTIDLYFLDSSNIEFLDLPDREIPEFVNRRVKE
jgi:hypothetical protein